MNHRVILGAAAAVAAILAVPSFASAATTCNFDTTKRQVNIQLANPAFGGQTAILRTSGDYIKVADNNELPRSCFIPGFTDLDHAAIASGTNKIRVTGSPSFERVLVSERDGQFSPGSLTNPFDGAKHVGTITLTPAGKASASGKLAIDRGATKIGHHGKTVTAELGLKVAKSLKGHTLSIDVAATDRNGHRQLQPGARSIRINP
jgi:hypothetical protein